MTLLTSRWIKNIFWPKKNVTKHCEESDHCNHLLQLILDGEATEEQENFFHEHVDKCVYCFNSFKVEKSIRDLIKSKIKKEEVPIDLVESIKLKIKGTA
ncbi:MAG: anti-sigma factor [Candidatus Cyclobacteriaceae bacterium M3_2C_046]